MTGTKKQNEMTQKVLYARGEFVKAESLRRGWPEDPEKLSISQILEITEMKEWKMPMVEADWKDMKREYEK